MCIYLFMAALGLHCCLGFSPVVAGLRGALPSSCGRLTAHSSCHGAPAPGHMGGSSCGSQAREHRLRSRGSRAQLLCSTWDLPGPGMEPASPVLAGGFFTTGPQGSPDLESFKW